jgi:hypothetical protein
MRTLILILFLVGQLQDLSAQVNAKEVKLPKLKGDLNCFYKPKYSAKKRGEFYPFNIADTIKLVSFRHYRHNYPIKGDTLLTDSLIEIKTLTKNETNDLTDILYNNFYKKRPNYGSMTQCFFPRNAILFYDKNGHLKESILLCFQCDRHQESSDIVNFGNDCTQKMEKLRLYFITSGLNFGTDRTLYLYPGENSDE